MTTFLSAWRGLDDARHRAELYRMWHVGASAGFTIPHALELMGPRRNRAAEAARTFLMDGTRAGRSLDELATSAGARLSSFERALLTLGARSGQLELVLRLLAEYQERRHRAMLAVRKRMAYPLFTGIVATFVAPFSLLYFGHVRAYVTVVIAGLAAWALAGGAIVVAAARRFGRQPALVRARFARALAIGIEAGLALEPALALAARASDDDALAACVLRAAARRDGAAMSDALAGCPHLTPDFLATLATAERTGDFTTTLTRLADLYEDGFR